MLTSGFVTGVNYWASNAGIKMWRDFAPEVIDDDFKRLAALKLDVVRLFPLWPDFQPIERLYAGCGAEADVCTENEQPLGHADLDFAGLDKTMLQRFSTVLDLAEKHGLKICVGIVTGWMSGRLFAPPALVGKNLLNDPTALYYELRFVRAFVRHFRQRRVIVGWTSGNETDCLAVVTPIERANWALNMYNAIRAEDSTRPVMEDMHPLRQSGADCLYDRHDMFEVTTVHPYAKFTPYALNEPITSMRGLLHAVAEAKVYEGVTGKPCLIEEVGTLGDFVCSKQISAGYVKAQAMSAWANGLTGFMWWCAHEQTALNYPPYDWCPLEQELGLLNADKTEKPAAVAFREVKQLITAVQNKLGGALPPARQDAVCVLEGSRDDWRNALGSYVLAKQAGFNLAFCTRRHLPRSNVYILPSVKVPVRAGFMQELAERVRQGATLLLTYEGGIVLSQLQHYFGVELITYSERGQQAMCGGRTYPAPVRLELAARGAEVLLREDDQNPALTVYPFGKGRMIFCTLPVEKGYAEGHGGQDAAFNLVYNLLARQMPLPLRRDNEKIGITAHPMPNGTTVIVAVNYSNTAQQTTYTLTGQQFGQALHGRVTPTTIQLEPFGTAVFSLVPCRAAEG